MLDTKCSTYFFRQSIKPNFVWYHQCGPGVMVKVIGHRGAAGLALENTTESIEAAIKAGVDAIEFDVRLTSDNKLVLSHDVHLGRVSEESHHISKHSLARLRKTQLYNGQVIATLTEAIGSCKDKPVYIEGKDNGWAKALADFLKSSTFDNKVSVISFNHQELYLFHLLMPDINTFAIEQTKPLDVIRTARLLGFTGIDLNFWILNPLTYALARFHRLEIIVYTLDKPWIARFLRILYPHISITTNVPDKMQFLRKRTYKQR